jgi:SagB-type dehydrogenase family enzyme
MHRIITGLILLVTMAFPASRNLPAEEKENVIALPPVATKGEVSLEELLWKRRSVREFDSRPLRTVEISRLCFAASGISDTTRGFRTAPSAGALYPLELHVVNREGRYRYLPEKHALSLEKSGDLRKALMKAALSQKSIDSAPCVFIISAVYERTRKKYGDRTERYVHMEAGHAAQNLLLQATALGLGGVPIGAFQDEAVKQALELRAEEAPLYLIPVGTPAK